MVDVPVARRVEIAKKASIAAVEALRVKADPYKVKYGEAEFKQIRHIMACAKQRCTNPNAIGYSNYGGRGISFEFPSVRSAAEWILDNLGARPPGTSIDRIDNNRGYAAGNLRWATCQEQARNKRAYKRTKNGERIRRLHTDRPDLTYETIRLWIAQGMSDADILGRNKYARSSL
jgi:hypothetical protein